MRSIKNKVLRFLKPAFMDWEEYSNRIRIFDAFAFQQSVRKENIRRL